MVGWDVVLKYEQDIRNIANRCRTVDPSLYEDVVHHTMLVMHTKLNLEGRTGPEREYVRGAIWKIVRYFLISRQHGGWSQLVSLEKLLANGVQIDLDRQVIWPSTDVNYRGSYRSSDDV